MTLMKTNEPSRPALLVQVPVSERDIWGLLTSAFESGSRFWIQSIEQEGPWPKGAPDRARLPLAGGALRITTMYENVPPRVLDKAALQRGLELMARLHPWHLGDMFRRTADAGTGDAFLQLCLFGEILFG